MMKMTCLVRRGVGMRNYFLIKNKIFEFCNHSHTFLENMSSYFSSPAGGIVTRGSHVGGALQTPAGIPGSQYPSEGGSFSSGPSWARGEMGSKLYPYTQVHILGKPLFARTSQDSLAYTPPT